MKDFWNVIQLVISALGGWLGYFLGGCDGLLYALIAFAAIMIRPARITAASIITSQISNDPVAFIILSMFICIMIRFPPCIVPSA